MPTPKTTIYNDNELLIATEAAALCGITIATLYNRRRRGEFPEPVRLGGNVRWRRKDLLAMLDGRRA